MYLQSLVLTHATTHSRDRWQQLMLIEYKKHVCSIKDCENSQEDFFLCKEHIEKYVKIVPSFDLYYELISNRIEEYIENPPPSDWEGVFVAKTK